MRLHTRRRESAAIITRDTAREYLADRNGTHATWADGVLQELLGCRFAATLDDDQGQALVTCCDGRQFTIAWEPSISQGARPPTAAVLTSVVYLLDVNEDLVVGSELPVKVRLGEFTATAVVTSD